METSEFHIFYTNDLHSHLEQWPKIISLFKEKRNLYEERGEDVLLFDIGDHADRFHPLTEATLGKANVQLMNEVGYDSATIGNNEGITISKGALSELYEEANFPVLVANLFEKNGERPNWLKPFHFVQLSNGLTVGIIGLTIPFRPFYEALGWKVEDPFEILPPLVKKVREQADIVIFLSHLGLNFDEVVADQIEGIDIILGGHTHHVLNDGLIIKNTLIHQAGKFGNYVGHLSITVNHQERRIENFKARCLAVNEYAPCEATAARIQRLSYQHQAVLNEEISWLKDSLTISWERPSSFAALLASAIREWCDGELGMANSGLLLEGLRSGPVTKGDLHRICPHPINPAKIELTGQQLKEIIHHGLSKEMIDKKIRGFGFRGEVMGIMVFDGVTYEEKKLSDGLTHAYNIKVNGQTIEHDRIYTVATVDLFTFGHIYPSIASAKIKTFYMPELLRDLLAWKLRRM
ncbi:MAG: bifunctional metallophosphatase/5'-nucleotidase [Anaerobacillus sp.]|uniref:bifunctional metallophosphatase/5'-nucleotidase n=1 Tax=Anaerobacillus sp. TaxID=1872506 RepID=UPI00391C40A0